MPKFKLKSCEEKKPKKEKDFHSLATDQGQSTLSKYFPCQNDKVIETVETKPHGAVETTILFNKNPDDLDDSANFKPKSKRLQSKLTNVLLTSNAKQIKKSVKNSKATVRKKAGKNKACSKQTLQQYTKAFGDVCSIGGVDVNPEQLQLAIALSRSLADSQVATDTNNEDSSQSTQESSKSQDFKTEEENVKRIRKTLEQYGFKVPIGPISLMPKANQRRKRFEKALANSALVTKSVEEKKQITLQLVSQILLESQMKISESPKIYQSNLKSSVLDEIWCKKSSIFAKAKLDFDEMNEFDIFYVKNLITPSDSKIGSLLKDWNSIPGRDPSPEREAVTADFRESVLFPEHLHLLLSSTNSCILDKISLIENALKNTSLKCSPVKLKSTQIHDSGSSETILVEECKVIDICDSRSCSPDIFIDDYDEDNQLIVSGKSEVANLPKIDLVYSSDDELPNVYLTQPRKITRESPLRVSAPCKDLHDILKIESDHHISDCIDLTQSNKSTYTRQVLNDSNIDDSLMLNTSQKESRILNETIIIDLENQSFQNPCVMLRQENHQMIDETHCEKNIEESNFLSLDKNKSMEMQKKTSMGSILDDSEKFDNLLGGFIDNESNKSLVDSIDLTQIYSPPVFSKNRNFSQIYENQNGIVHFESFHESVEPLDISFESPMKLHSPRKNLLACESEKNVNNSSDSLVCNETESLIDIQRIEDIDKNIDLTQSSNDSLVLTQNHNKSKSVESLDDYKNISSDMIVKDLSGDISTRSEIFAISDEEFNYSISSPGKRKLHHSKSKVKIKSNCNDISLSILEESKDKTPISKHSDFIEKTREKIIEDLSKMNNENKDSDTCIPSRLSKNFVFYGSSIFDQIPSLHDSNFLDTSKQKTGNETKSDVAYDDFVLPEYPIDLSGDLPNICEKDNTGDISEKGCYKSPAKGMDTPECNKYIIKTDNITPALDYTSMDTPNIHKELSKFGLKPLKRKRAVQLLEHIYNQTHPVVNINDLEMKLKRRKIIYNNFSSPKSTKSPRKSRTISPSKSATSPVKSVISPVKSPIKNITVHKKACNYLADRSDSENLCQPQNFDLNLEPSRNKPESSKFEVKNEDIYQPDSNIIYAKQVHCDPEDWIFQNKEKSKVQGCRVPLHIAFYNYLAVRSKLRDAILRYDPVNVDDIHKGLVADGYKYNAKDLFHFMDKKCITIKTTDKSGGARYQKKA